MEKERFKFKKERFKFKKEIKMCESRRRSKRKRRKRSECWNEEVGIYVIGRRNLTEYRRKEGRKCRKRKEERMKMGGKISQKS